MYKKMREYSHEEFVKLGEFFYINSINSKNNKRKMIMIREDINISFFFIVSPPSLEVWLHPTIKCSYLHFTVD